MKLNRRNKLIFGIGVNDAEYNVHVTERVKGKQRIVSTCPFYSRWGHMLRRCYSQLYQSKKPTYIGCSVCEEWLTFSNFKAWMETQDWEGKHLDKDILVLGNKVYGPDTCVFVDQKVNSFTNECRAARGKWPIGVNWYPNYEKFAASCHCVTTGKQKNLGYYDTPEEAHAAWLVFKLEQAYILASKQTDTRVAKALIERYENFRLT